MTSEQNKQIPVKTEAKTKESQSLSGGCLVVPVILAVKGLPGMCLSSNLTIML